MCSSGFPLPPADEAGLWAGCKCNSLASDAHAVKALRQQILNGDTSGDAIPVLGGYLRGILLGPVWARVEAATPPGEPIEIEITCDPEDATMNRLPWEMMVSGDTPLGAQTGRVVGVTRMVEGKTPNTAAIELPLRVLFVIGRQIDPNLRPGAEYLGVIRQVNATLQQGGREARSIDINLQLLPEATTEELKAAVESFEPSVIHFIAHGRQEGSESVIVLSKKDGLSVQEDPRTARSLIESIRRKDGQLPPIVVLNACHTGEANDAYVPFAATLAREGVGIALGMAGEVSDAACRIFTRALYQALVDGKSVVVAGAFARRAAMLNYGDFLGNAEWTRPTLFRNTQALPQFQVNPAQRAIAQAAFRFRSVREPAILCDRLDSMSAYQRFRDQVLSGDLQTPLVLEVSDDESTVSPGVQTGRRVQIGKSRLVSEIASNAVLQGLAPCVLPSAAGFEPPSSLLTLAVRIAEVMDITREYLGLNPRVTSAALKKAFVATGTPYAFDPAQLDEFRDIRDDVKKKAGEPGAKAVATDTVRDAFAKDVETLLDDLNSQFPVTAGLPRFQAVLLLVDDLHRYEAVAVPLLELVRDFGIAKRAALAFTYSTRSKSGPDVAEHIKANLRGFVHEPLRPFRSPVESRLAYTQMLMARNPPLVPSGRAEERENVESFFEFCHTQVLGVPSLFPLSEASILLSARYRILLDADDERILRERTTKDGVA
jgi:hypothetical protein